MQSPSSKVFPVVSMGKFTLLYFSTMGWYALYWFYQCWVAMGKDSKRNLFPLLRSLFAVFFVHELFSYIQKKEDQNAPYPWQPAKSAWLFIGVGALGVILTFISDALKFNGLISLLIFVILLFVQFYVLYKVQLVINRVEQDPFGQSNAKLTLENGLWGAFGLYLWFSSFYTCYLEMTGQITRPSIFETQMKKDNSTPKDAQDL